MDERECRIVEPSDGGLFNGSEDPTEADLSELGAQGWELTAALIGSNQTHGGRPKSETSALVFKRPKG